MTSEFQEFVSHSKEEELNEIVEELNSKTVREMIENTIKMNCRYPDQLGSVDIQDPLLVLLPGDQLGAIYTVFKCYHRKTLEWIGGLWIWTNNLVAV